MPEPAGEPTSETKSRLRARRHALFIAGFLGAILYLAKVFHFGAWQSALPFPYQVLTGIAEIVVVLVLPFLWLLATLKAGDRVN